MNPREEVLWDLLFIKLYFVNFSFRIYQKSVFL